MIARISKRGWAAAAAAAAVLVLVAPDEGNAIPAFARKYRMSCTTCHAPVPRLKPYGEEFAGNAYRLEGKEPVRYYPDAGDTLLTLVRELPLAMRFDAHAGFAYRNEEDMLDLMTPFGVKLMSGGNIAPKISYYLYFYMSEKGEVVGLEDAFLFFRDLFGTGVDATVGQFQTSDPLFKRELRLTYEDYQIYKVNVGRAPTDLTYDRGFMLARGLPTGTDLLVGVVNGNGIEPAGDFFDDDDWKNVFVRASQEIGTARLGGFGYFGRAHEWAAARTLSSDITYWGIDGTIDVGKNVQLNAQYLERADENPFFAAADPRETKTRGGFVEAFWAVRGELGRTFVTLLYNYIDSDVDEAYEGASALDYRSEAVNVSYLLRRNLRLTGEVIHREVEDEWNVVAGMVTGF